MWNLYHGTGTGVGTYLRSIGIRIRVDPAFIIPVPFVPADRPLSTADPEAPPEGPSCMSGSNDGFSVACGKSGSLSMSVVVSFGT